MGREGPPKGKQLKWGGERPTNTTEASHTKNGGGKKRGIGLLEKKTPSTTAKGEERKKEKRRTAKLGVPKYTGTA